MTGSNAMDGTPTLPHQLPNTHSGDASVRNLFADRPSLLSAPQNLFADTPFTDTLSDAAIAPTKRHFLLLGICGAGMKALCEMLLDQGHKVTGADSQLTAESETQAERWAWLASGRSPDSIFITDWSSVSQDGRCASNTDAVIVSNAIPDHADCVTVAQKAGQPVFRLTHALNLMLKNCRQLCIAGTHGKTTTTAMLWKILAGEFARAAFIGGPMLEAHRSGFFQPGRDPQNLGSAGLNRFDAGSPSGKPWAVVESCEYRNAFSSLSPDAIVLTGVERDHFDCFPDQATEDAVFRSFVSKLNSPTKTSGDKFVVTDSGDRRAMAALKGLGEDICVITHSSCGVDSADWRAENIRSVNGITQFEVVRSGQIERRIQIALPGLHNVRNAMAAIATASRIGVPFEQIAQALEGFRGVRRRFEYRGEWRQMRLIDDYAHHPTAIRATLQTARAMFTGRRLIAVFEPHQISRLEQMFEEFRDSLTLADECLILPVLAARENSTRALCCRTSGRLVRSINLAGGRAFLLADLDQVIGRIDHAGRPGDVVITMGAGRTNQIHDEFNRRLQRDSVA
ncbi:MAG: hypothetical protein KDA91_07360 [Planctomycetaceae bacterium]|nr:hypothetical protein [Planctomycetaceae bacterium]